MSLFGDGLFDMHLPVCAFLCQEVSGFLEALPKMLNDKGPEVKGLLLLHIRSVCAPQRFSH